MEDIPYEKKLLQTFSEDVVPIVFVYICRKGVDTL